MSWVAAAVAGGKVISAYGAKKAGGKYEDLMNRLSTEYGEASGPKNVTGMLGGVSFDPDTGNMTTNLSPEMQTYYDRLISRSDDFANQITEYGTGEDAARTFGDMRRSLTQESNYADQLRSANRRVAQGRDVTTGGAQEAAIERMMLRRAENEATVGDWDRGQKGLDALYGRESKNMQNLVTTGKLPDAYGQTGMQLGRDAQAVAAKIAEMQRKGSGTKIAADANFWGSVGSAVSGWGSGMPSGGSSYDYTNDYGSAAGTAGNPGFGPNTMFSGAGNWTYV